MPCCARCCGRPAPTLVLGGPAPQARLSSARGERVSAGGGAPPPLPLWARAPTRGGSAHGCPARRRAASAPAACRGTGWARTQARLCFSGRAALGASGLPWQSPAARCRPPWTRSPSLSIHAPPPHLGAHRVPPGLSARVHIAMCGHTLVHMVDGPAAPQISLIPGPPPRLAATGWPRGPRPRCQRGPCEHRSSLRHAFLSEVIAWHAADQCGWRDARYGGAGAWGGGG
jgi:hypothetical protein